MTSMRTLNRRLLRWRRYARRTCWNPRVTRPAWMSRDTAVSSGHTRAWDARENERIRRACLAYDPYPGGECCCNGCVGMGPCDDELGVSDEDGLDDVADLNCPCGNGCWDDDFDDCSRRSAMVTVDTGGLT